MARQKNVIDEAVKDLSVAPVQYRITSFGADYDVEGLVRRLDRDDIFIPHFQRDFVWTMVESSRFIESLLLGLPVPGVFLARDDETKRLLVIDGQQRLKTLQFFKTGFFNPKVGAKSKRVFRLTRVQDPFEGRTYEQLNEPDKRILNDSIIHATIVHQDEPENDDTSIYHIFERLNTSGRKLSPQQIRVAIYHGPFIELLRKLNDYPNWRSIYGSPSNTLKDHELILRFLAFYFNADSYKRPMKEFLNTFTISRRMISNRTQREYRSLFTRTIDTVMESIGLRACRPERALNAAVFDSVMPILARKLKEESGVDSLKIKIAYDALLANEDYQKTYLEGTSDERNVKARLSIVQSTFKSL